MPGTTVSAAPDGPKPHVHPDLAAHQARIAEPRPDTHVGTEEFMDAIASRLREKLN